MSDTVKLIIEIPEEAKQAFDNAESNDLKGGYYDHGGIIGKAIQSGIPLDNDSDRAEVQAYFAGQTYGWEQGRKVLIDDIKAEIREQQKEYQEWGWAYDDVLEILDNIGKESEVKPNETIS